MNLRTEEDFLFAIQRFKDCAARIDSLLDQFLPENARELLEEFKDGKINNLSLHRFTNYAIGKGSLNGTSDLLPVEYQIVEESLRRCSLKGFLDEVYPYLPDTAYTNEIRDSLIGLAIPDAVDIFDQVMDVYSSFAREALLVSGIDASLDYIKSIYERCYTIIDIPIARFTDDQLESFSSEYLECDKAARDFKDEWLSYEKSFFEHRKERFEWGVIYEALLLKMYAGDGDGDDDSQFSEGCGFVYFVRNGDLFKVGITENLLRRMGELAPDEILNCVRCSNFRELEREIHSAFKEVRLPQTEYFRLSESQVQQVHRMIAERSVM